MQIVSENDIVFGNTTNSKSFTISASAKAFKVLSSNIYKNKIRAVVRELVCNAVDAHVLNQQTKPYVVKAPNPLDPRFIVRDFGPGLSDEDMIELYTTYFASTKAERNDQIGALGLGSKSPFAYTSTFSVVSYFEGIARVYNCVLSNGEPAIIKVHESPFVEGDENGIEVIVPVKSDDLSRWAEEISYVMRPFKSGSYTIKGSSSIEIDSFDKLTDNHNHPEWIGVNDSSNHNRGVYALYGNIVYPLAEVPGLNASWLRIHYQTIYVKFELGQLDIQPSREELSLDETTVKNIVTKVNRLSLSLMESDISHLESIENDREIYREIQTMSQNMKNTMINDSIMIKGKNVNHYLNHLDIREIHKLLTDVARVYSYSYDGSARVKKPVLKSERGRNVRASEVLTNSIFHKGAKKAFILIMDQTKHQSVTMRGWYLSDDEDSPTRYKDYVVKLFKDDLRNDKVIAEIKSLMGDDEVIIKKSSEMEEYRKLVKGYGEPKAVKEKRPVNPNATKYVWNEKEGWWNSKELYLTVKESEELSGLVIGLYRDTISVFGSDFRNLSDCNLYSIRTIAMNSNVKEFVAIRPSLYKRALNNPDLRCLYKEILKRYIHLSFSLKQEDYYYCPTTSNTKLLYNLRKHEYFGFMRSLFLNVDSIEESNNLKEFYTFFASHKNQILGKSRHKTIIRMCNSKVEKNMDVAKLKYEKANDWFRNEYPSFHYHMSKEMSIGDKSRLRMAEQLKILMNL